MSRYLPQLVVGVISTLRGVASSPQQATEFHQRRLQCIGAVVKGVGTTQIDAMLKPRERKYLFAPAIIWQVYQLFTSSFA